ncbi:hypothetical protein ACFLUT_03270 [Chloroflexota bacterium]
MDDCRYRLAVVGPTAAEGLSNFCMVGQWVEPGSGLPPAASSGRNLTQILCNQDGKKFVTTVP